MKARECPECGAQFLPSEFEFVPNSVRFCCPDCNQDYYGTGEHGHLIPPEFNCVHCGRALRMDDMVLFTTEGVREEQTKIERMPWLDRDGVGFFKRWLRTIWMSMFAPSRLMALTPLDSSAGQAGWFALLTGGLASLGCILLILPFVALPMLMASRGAGRGGWAAGGASLLGTLAFPLSFFIFILLWGAIAHVVLVATGSTQAGSRRTYQAMFYSSAANIIGAVPCLGFYLFPVAWIWWSVSAILMLREGQKVSTFRALLATLLLPAVLAVGGTCLVVYVAKPIIQSAQMSMRQSTQAASMGPSVQMASMGAVGQSNLTLLAADIGTYASEHRGRLPGHASELIVTTSVSAFTFVNSDVQALPKVPVASTNLQRFLAMSSTSQQAMTHAAARALPANVVAHRLGDFVFTYHGIDFNKADKRLWIVVLAPEGPAKDIGPVQIAMVDGTTTAIKKGKFATELIAQNALRRSKGLPPLPDPRNVTHAQPAIASQPASTSSAETRTGS